MSCVCSATSRARVIVFTDLVIALVLTIYRVTSLSLVLKRVFGVENGQLVDSQFNDAAPEYLVLMKYSTVFLITATVIGLAIEIFMFFLLNNGVRSKNYRHCKHWFILRILLLILGILGTVIEHVRRQYELIDGLLEVEKLYRIVTLLVVRNFMQEIYKGMSDNNYEHHSSSVGGDGYPNGNASVNNQLRSHSHTNV